MNFDHDWLTPKEAADYLRVSVSKVRKLYNDGSLQIKRIGTGPKADIRISADSLKKYMNVA